MAIIGLHTIVYSSHAEEVRAFFRDVLDYPSADAGGGWLIFAMPPAELAVHPGDEPRQELYLMCDDLPATMTELTAKGVTFTKPVDEQRWGAITAIALPGGTEIGLYQPYHPLPPR
ncbi:hypothetical protein GCM10009765_46370 [Fodinicola feengrottensis]|uniref:VOC domain-containing protein n=1 Tax=Fodinicola feengrottensis TaxID=435914 RepID=A0ABN2HQB0_9ACTN